MSGIRGKNTRPEVQIRKVLHRLGFRFRLHVKQLPGKPDIVLPKYRAIVLVSGCFWHGHDCHLFKMPGTNRDFWDTKIDRNRTHDRHVSGLLMEGGWRVAVVWECALRGKDKLEDDVIGTVLAKWIKSSTPESLVVRGKASRP